MYIYTRLCPSCRQQKQMSNKSQYCSECTPVIEKAKHDAFIQERENLSVEERLSLIEDYIYKASNRLIDDSPVYYG